MLGIDLLLFLRLLHRYQHTFFQKLSRHYHGICIQLTIVLDLLDAFVVKINVSPKCADVGISGARLNRVANFLTAAAFHV
jgi:hypothetical protein